MNSFLTILKARDFLVAMLLLQFVTCLFILFDVPMGRQLVGFVYFTTIPGYLIVKLLNLDSLGRIETAAFSVGFSIALLMLGGLVLNQLCPLIGISRPLSLLPLMVFFNIFALLSEISLYLRSRNVKFWTSETFRLYPSILLLGLPVLSVVGALLVSFSGNNLILLFLILAISMLVVLGVFASKLFPSNAYPLAVLIIAVSLLFHSALISKYLITFGSDVTLEYVMSQFTINSGRWTSSGLEKFGRLDPMLSITILPTIYHNLLNIDLTSIYKVAFPLIFSLVPLGLYALWQRKIGSKAAFIVTFLVMAQETFYTEMLGLGRQMIAELFLVLLLIIVLNVKMESYKKMMCFAVFSAGLVVSHYSLAIIFLIFISITFVFLKVIKRPSRNITASMVLIFFVMMFSWYIYTSSASAFYDILSYGNYVYEQLGQFFSGSYVPRWGGVNPFETPPTVWNAISRGFAYLTQFLIVVGFLGLLTRKTANHYDTEYIVVNSIAMGFLVATIIVPGLASTFNITRFYHILLFFLAPFFLLGAKMLVKLLPKRKTEFAVSLLVVAVLVPYFLFQTSFVYEIVGSQSWSMPLSSYRMSPYQLYAKLGYPNELCIVGASWVRRNVNTSATQMYADSPSTSPLYIYGALTVGHIISVSNVSNPFVEPYLSLDAIVFLSPLAVNYNTVISRYLVNNLTQLAFLEDMNKIYSNGGSEIYKK